MWHSGFWNVGSVDGRVLHLDVWRCAPGFRKRFGSASFGPTFPKTFIATQCQPSLWSQRAQFFTISGWIVSSLPMVTCDALASRSTAPYKTELKTCLRSFKYASDRELARLARPSFFGFSCRQRPHVFLYEHLRIIDYYMFYFCLSVLLRTN